jgi:transcriptional regulator with XRE-family HTH domain
MNAIDKMSVFTQIRKKAKISQTEFAKVLGVTNVTLSRWEAGIHQPTLTFKQYKTLSHILIGMGLSINDLPDDEFGEIQNLCLEDDADIKSKNKTKEKKHTPNQSFTELSIAV